MVEAFGDMYYYDTATQVVYIGAESAAIKQDVVVHEDWLANVVRNCVKEGMSREEILRAFHNFVVLHLEYGYIEDGIGDSWNAMDAYKYQTGVCEAYAKLFKELCDRAVIPCELVMGSGNGQALSKFQFY